MKISLYQSPNLHYNLRCIAPQVRYLNKSHANNNYFNFNPRFVCHAAQDDTSNDQNKELNDSVENLIQNLLDNDPEAANQVNRVSDAAKKVAELQMEQARLARALADSEDSSEAAADRRNRLAEEEASNIMAKAEVQAAQLRLQAAELEASLASSQREKAQSQANMDAERMETGKAGVAGAIGSVLVLLPLALANTSPALALESIGDGAVSAFLFGLVYRYAVRDDVSWNNQLKGGVVAAFGLVRGIAVGSGIIGGADKVMLSNGSGESGVSLDVVGKAALAMGESMLVFGFASVVLEFAFQNGVVKRFNGFK